MNKQKVFILGWFLFAIIVPLVFTPNKGEADTLDSFTAAIKTPASQKDKSLTYYDLLLKPDAIEKLPVTLTNKSDQPLELQLSFNRAINNLNGTIEYSGTNEGKSDSAPYDIEKYVSLTDSAVTLAANETKTIFANVKMPPKQFDGILAGGIYIQQKDDTDFAGNVENLFAREIAVLLHSNNKSVTSDIKIAEANSTQINERNAIELEVENRAAAYTKELNFSYTVLLNDEETKIQEKRQLKMAPNTKMNYYIPFAGEGFSPGTYTVKTKITDGDQVWEASPKFTVSKKSAADFNKADVTIEEKPFPWLTVGIGAVVLILAVIVGGLMYHNKKLQSELEKTKKNADED